MSAINWDQYWVRAREQRRKSLYERLAEFYRKEIISRSAAHVLSRYFRNERSRQYLHAGCGSGGSDQRMRLDQPRFHALDISLEALALSQERSMPLDRRFICGDLFRLPYRANTMDGVFNFGVMEHFVESDIGKILVEFHRVLKREGYLVLFWPPDFGLSVIALTSWLRLVNAFRKEPMVLYPDEVSRIKSFRWVRKLMAAHGFKVVRTHFGLRDLFTYVVVVAQPA